MDEMSVVNHVDVQLYGLTGANAGNYLQSDGSWGGSVWISTGWGLPSSTWTFHVNGLASGNYSLLVRAVDNAGNTQTTIPKDGDGYAFVSSRTFTIDSTPPIAVVVVPTATRINSISAISGTARCGVGTVRVRLWCATGAPVNYWYDLTGTGRGWSMAGCDFLYNGWFGRGCGSGELVVHCAGGVV